MNWLQAASDRYSFRNVEATNVFFSMYENVVFINEIIKKMVLYIDLTNCVKLEPNDGLAFQTLLHFGHYLLLLRFI